MPRELELVRATVRSHFLVKEDGQIVTEAASEVTVYAKDAAGLEKFVQTAREQIEAQLGPKPNRAARRTKAKAKPRK